MPRTIGIGLQDFSKMIETGCFYVDKTDFIREWWENCDEVTLITRPRRFGKTLTMSMVEQFFSVKYEKRGDLFENLEIWQNEKYHALQGTYPVIFLSFANIKSTSYEKTCTQICTLIAREYARHSFLLDSDCLIEQEKELFREKIAHMDDVSAVSALNQLSEYLSRYYGKRVIILLDEYDTPMQEAYVRGYWNELADFIRELFNSTFKTNPYLERAILTGITRVSRESIFSDLNNLEVITTTSDKYETAFGFTEEEVFHVLEEYGLEDKKQKVKYWYDGFIFGSCSNIYNPWSIINFLKKKRFAAYWANTSSNSLAGKLIREGSKDVKLVMEKLLDGQTFPARIDEQVVFSQLDNDENAIWSLLLAGGYLKACSFSDDETWGETFCDLALTNHEVNVTFRKMIHGWFTGSQAAYNGFIRALLDDDKKLMNAYMNQVALATFSSFDTGKKPSVHAQPERFYHGFVLGLLVDLGDRYVITSNRESGYGRYDVMLEPRNDGDDGIILEFKVHDPDDEETLEDTVRSALRQMEDRKYAVMLEEKGTAPGRIRSYGFAFEGRQVLIDGGY